VYRATPQFFQPTADLQHSFRRASLRDGKCSGGGVPRLIQTAGVGIRIGKANEHVRVAKICEPSRPAGVPDRLGRLPLPAQRMGQALAGAGVVRIGSERLAESLSRLGIPIEPQQN